MPDKHRGAVNFHFPDGAFRPLTSTEPLQLLHVYEWELAANKSATISVSDTQKIVILCVSGEGSVSASETIRPINKGHVVLSTVSLSVSSDSQPLRCLCMVVDVFPSLQPTPTTDLYELAEYLCAFNGVLVVEDAEEYERVFLSFLSELCLPEPTMLLVKGCFYQAMIVAYRLVAHRSVDCYAERIGVNAVGQTVYAIIRYIDEHLFAINNLMDMAKELGYSYNYLSHLFRRKTGMTIQTYVTQKKIEQSTVLLRDERYSVTQIASMLNYDCIQSFSKAFKRAMNMSPTEYRALHVQINDKY